MAYASRHKTMSHGWMLKGEIAALLNWAQREDEKKHMPLYLDLAVEFASCSQSSF
jgi:hypothetical protein